MKRVSSGIIVFAVVAFSASAHASNFEAPTDQSAAEALWSTLGTAPGCEINPFSTKLTLEQQKAKCTEAATSARKKFHVEIESCAPVETVDTSLAKSAPGAAFCKVIVTDEKHGARKATSIFLRVNGSYQGQIFEWHSE